MSAERPFALPGLRGDNLLTRSLARGIDQWARWAGWAGQRRQLPVAPEARLKVVYIDHVARMSGGEIALVRLIDALVDVDAHVILGEDGPLVPALRQCGATVEVLPLRSSTRDLRRADTVRLLTVARSAVEVVGYSWHLARRLRELQPDLVHTNSLKAGYYGTLAAKLARVPVMWHVRDRIAPDYLPRPTVLATRALLRCLPDVVLANSNATLRTVIPDDRPWGRNSHSVVAEMVSNIGPNVRHHRPDTSQTIGMVGRLVDWKGQEVFIRAFAQAFSGEEKMRARIVGSALFEETAYARGLSELIDQLQLTGRIVLTGHRDDVAAEMRKIDILVHASTLPEPFGLVIIEGMAMGLAVIASDGGGPREIITNEVNGLLTPMGDIDALSQAMRRLHTDPDLRYRLSNGALIRAADFAPGVIGPKVSTLYRDTLARRFSHDNKVGALR